jgi:hypothetical protein
MHSCAVDKRLKDCYCLPNKLTTVQLCTVALWLQPASRELTALVL